MRRIRILPAVGIAVLTIASVGCGETSPATSSEPTARSSCRTTARPPPDDPGAPSDDTTDEPEGGGRLAGCERLEETDDGVYRVADAGELTMRRDGDRLVLEEVRSADGWNYQEDDRDDDDEVEVDFTRDGREIVFEAEVDDGVLEIEICED